MWKGLRGVYSHLPLTEGTADTLRDIPEVSHLEEDGRPGLLLLWPSTLLSGFSKIGPLLVLEFSTPFSPCIHILRMHFSSINL